MLQSLPWGLRQNWLNWISVFSWHSSPDCHAPTTRSALAILPCHLNLNRNDFTWFSYFYYVPAGLTWHTNKQTHTHAYVCMHISGVMPHLIRSLWLPSLSHTSVRLFDFIKMYCKHDCGVEFLTIYLPHLPGGNFWFSIAARMQFSNCLPICANICGL